MNGDDMAGGWTRDGAIQDQIDDTITDGVLAARARLPGGEGTTHCVECGEEIPEARRRALPAARTCVPCQSGRDSRVVHGAINRRGSKDSQLR
jgi:phage/conjugal plasmid C-4 type zinc finger TraR family protein